MEQWKDIEGYEGLYQISNEGAVKSIRGINRQGKKTPNGIMCQFTDKRGYKHIAICKNGKRLGTHVHRLIALSFIDNTENKPEVNHIDHNPSNNNISNLEWCTHAENMLHSKGNSNRRNNSQKIRGSNHFRSYPIKMISKDNEIKIFGSIPEALESIGRGRNSSLVCMVLNGKRKKAYNYKWEKIC